MKKFFKIFMKNGAAVLFNQVLHISGINPGLNEQSTSRINKRLDKEFKKWL